MNNYEKIIFATIGIVIFIITIFSFKELTKNNFQEITENEISDFDKSFGPEFKILNFTTITNSTSSPSLEENCNLQKPVIVSVLYGIKENLEGFGDDFMNKSDDFQVNQKTLNLFCHKTAQITLANTDGDKLTLEKLPFVREVPEGGEPDDIGTMIKINATITLAKSNTVKQSTTSAQMLIPDKLLEK